MSEKDYLKLHREKAVATTFVFIGFVLMAMVVFIIFGSDTVENRETVREAQARGAIIAAEIAEI